MVQVSGREVRARVCGRANFASCVDFKSLITAMEARGFRQFVLDLGDCPIMDSTFVGVLASLGSRMESSGVGGYVELLNANDRILELLDNLGIDDLFRLSRRDLGDMAGCDTVEASPAGHTKAELSRTSLEAHTKLMELNPDNVAKFKDVTEFLAGDLKRIEQQQSGDDAPQR